jgi:chromosome segregation ATPase
MSFNNLISSLFSKNKLCAGQDKNQNIADKKQNIAELIRDREKLLEIHKKIVEDKEKQIGRVKEELEKEREITKHLKEEIEKKRAPGDYEESIKKLQSDIAELSSKYKEANDRFEKERQNTVCLEMLLLDIDKELGLMNIVKKMDEK